MKINHYMRKKLVNLSPKGVKDNGIKSFGPDFYVFLVEETKDKISSSVLYLLNVKEDPFTQSDAMASQDNAFWKEAVDDEMQSIMGNTTWVLIDLLLTCKPIGCKWIFRKSKKIDGKIFWWHKALDKGLLLITLIHMHPLQG